MTDIKTLKPRWHLFKAERLFNGPPVGWAVQVRVTGPERAEVRRIADEIAGVMRATPDIGNVHDDWLEPVPSLKLEIDQDRSRALGVTSQAVRRSLQGSLSGVAVRTRAIRLLELGVNPDRSKKFRLIR